MTAPAPADLLHKVWEYPLFEALYGGNHGASGWVSRWPKVRSNTNLAGRRSP